MELSPRQGFLVSITVHFMVLATLTLFPHRRKDPSPATPQVVHKGGFFPSPRELAPFVARIPLKVHDLPAPPRPPKDRISIGGPSPDQRKGPLVLRRDEDLARPPAGRPDAVPGQGDSAAPDSAPNAARPAASSQATRAEGSGSARSLPQGGPSIASSLRNWERRLGQGGGTLGVPGGTGKQMGPLFFDPEGADFTSWINHFKNEVYRNWIVPEAALFGFRGHVDFEFSVERDGRLVGLKLLQSSGTAALDRAAQNALLGARLLPLPEDFAPAMVTMQVTFFYNEGPQGS